ncbi:uncharacterized protein LOC130711911 isoform X2 [Lotus japonicus]|uniref:uncharacterized protein LOC130711911 isoform X2 n=1 Tax=Lotus japonicus TaxID=34305 RepID=UPI00258F475C|nr:uncharacterized protein LOC130711911 isoform X2 [Lotus japonicus]
MVAAGWVLILDLGFPANFQIWYTYAGIMRFQFVHWCRSSTLFLIATVIWLIVELGLSRPKFINTRLSQLLKEHDEELWRHLEITSKRNKLLAAIQKQDHPLSDRSFVTSVCKQGKRVGRKK